MSVRSRKLRERFREEEFGLDINCCKPSTSCKLFVTRQAAIDIITRWISMHAIRGGGQTRKALITASRLFSDKIYVDAMLPSVEFPGMTMAVEWSVAIDQGYAPGLKGYHCSGLFCYPFDRYGHQSECSVTQFTPWATWYTSYRTYTSFFGREALSTLVDDDKLDLGTQISLLEKCTRSTSTASYHQGRGAASPDQNDEPCFKSSKTTSVVLCPRVLRRRLPYL
ncbi:hypothetical protein IW261DRAFT_1677261 [Armillaria novae-zelandiae]|uniref:Uncharacterized protein n=1 Tax=Armillaria novae-zelandiae TaxID=153914 RepID=A0AA39NNA3_9AGAR|nr:hypothetical protein IW261DRAFT_1677261 [Armillaria novae-zelandiae]